MKRCLIFVSILALAACTTDSGSGGGGNGGSYNHSVIGNGTSSGSMSGGGSTGGNTGGNTNSGNTNNQQEQIIHYTNFKQYFDDVIKTGAYYTDFVENTQNWPGHGSYKHYEYNQHSTSGTNHIIYHNVVDEKEMQLANYGVSKASIQYEFEPEGRVYSESGYIHNREGVDSNLYTPVENTYFEGGTLAYLGHADARGDILLKGDATFRYSSTNPELVLDYDNYYTFDIVKDGSGGETTTVSGSNGTGNNFYDVTTGSYTDNNGRDANFTAGYLQKGAVQEAVGTYEMYFGPGDIGGNTTNDFFIKGAFGGSQH